MRLRFRPAMNLPLRCVFVLLAAAAFASVGGGQQIPATQAQTLAGTTVSFPDVASGKPLLFVVGFSHKGGEQCEAWNKQLSPLYLNDSRVSYYEAADFQGVPSLILKMILHGMRKEIPANQHSRFVLLESNEEEWKKLANYSASDDAYVILASPGGRVVWQTKGPMDPAQLQALQAALAKLQARAG
jgi:ATP synthase subunit 10